MAEQRVQPPFASASATWGWPHALGSTRVYDLAVRLVFIAAILFLALPSAVGVATRVPGHPGAWDLALLADLHITQPVERWIAQLEQGPTAAARLQAIDALRAIAEEGTQPVPPAAGAALLALMRDSRAHHSLQREAAEAQKRSR